MSDTAREQRERRERLAQRAREETAERQEGSSRMYVQSSGLTPRLPHTPRGRLVAPKQYRILCAIAHYNVLHQYPTRYKVAMRFGRNVRRTSYTYRAIQSLLDQGLIRLFGENDKTRLLVVTPAGKSEIAYWTKKGQL